MAVVDQKSLRLAREVRKAVQERREDEDLQAAIEVYDAAVTVEERIAAASYLLEHTTRADNRYTRRVRLAFIRMVAPELLREEDR